MLESVPGNVSDRPRAVRFEAGVGDEIIEFEPAVFLEGKVKRDVLLWRRIKIAHLNSFWISVRQEPHVFDVGEWCATQHFATFCLE